MLRSSLLALTIASVALPALSSAQFTLTPQSPPHLALAERVALGLRTQAQHGLTSKLTMQNGQPVWVPYNRYGGSWNTGYVIDGHLDWVNNVPIPDPAFENYSVCASFVSRCLKQAYNWNWTNYPVPGEGATASPNSRQYAKLIKAGLGMTELKVLSKVTSGDIITIDYKSDSNSEAASGHTMIVRQRLGFFATTPNSKDPNTYLVWRFGIADSTSSPHDSVADRSDSRVLMGQNNQVFSWQGAGVGEFRIITDLNHNILGYWWSHTTATYSYTYRDAMANNGQSQQLRPITIGRIKL
jgi:hypothetical protein